MDKQIDKVIDKPLVLATEELRNDLAKVINNAAKQVPMFIIELIVTDIQHQVINNKRVELDKAIKLYNDSLNTAK